MRLSANDVRSAVFQKRMRGLDPDEVASFLDSVASRIEELEAENLHLKEGAGQLQKELDQHRDRDQSLRDALIEVRQSSEETRETARREAGLIVKEAELKAERLLAESQAQERGLKKDLVQLAERRERYVSRLRHLLRSQLEMLDALSEDLKDNETGEEQA